LVGFSKLIPSESVEVNTDRIQQFFYGLSETELQKEIAPEAELAHFSSGTSECSGRWTLPITWFWTTTLSDLEDMFLNNPHRSLREQLAKSIMICGQLSPGFLF
jgi:hypothetical protein